jgi:alkyl sulfatase BDS1-like metallo-beta-lactamase superfamily hydrolase
LFLPQRLQRDPTTLSTVPSRRPVRSRRLPPTRQEDAMATVEECEKALHDLAARLSTVDAQRKKEALDRSLSCTLRDLGVIFGARLRGGELRDIRQVNKADAQIRLTVSSDDLIMLTSGKLSFASAWATGKLRIDANVFDLLTLRSIF